MATTRQDILRQGIDLLGREELALRMKVPVSVLEAWEEGKASMPDRSFEVLTGILADFDQQRQ